MKALAEARGGGKRTARATGAKASAQASGARGNGVAESFEHDDEEDEQVLRRFGEPDAQASAVPPSVHDALREPGHPLAPPVRRDFERRLARDFSQVRVHTGDRAAASAEAVGAAAYTVGR